MINGQIWHVEHQDIVKKVSTYEIRSAHWCRGLKADGVHGTFAKCWHGMVLNPQA